MCHAPYLDMRSYIGHDVCEYPNSDKISAHYMSKWDILTDAKQVADKLGIEIILTSSEKIKASEPKSEMAISQTVNNINSHMSFDMVGTGIFPIPGNLAGHSSGMSSARPLW